LRHRHSHDQPMRRVRGKLRVVTQRQSAIGLFHHPRLRIAVLTRASLLAFSPDLRSCNSATRPARSPAALVARAAWSSPIKRSTSTARQLICCGLHDESTAACSYFLAQPRAYGHNTLFARLNSGGVFTASLRAWAPGREERGDGGSLDPAKRTERTNRAARPDAPECGVEEKWVGSARMTT